MAETAGLQGQRIKIVLRRFHPQTPREIILPGSSSEHLDNEIQRRKPLTVPELGRQSSARPD